MATRTQYLQNGRFQKYARLARLADIRQTLCEYSPDSPTFAKLFCEDSPYSRKASLASVKRIWRICRVWGYKICFFVHKTTYLSMCTMASTRELTFSRDSPTFAKHFARTRQTRRHSPKAISEKNVTRLAKFARVMRESREFGESCHCLI